MAPGGPAPEPLPREPSTSARCSASAAARVSAVAALTSADFIIPLASSTLTVAKTRVFSILAVLDTESSEVVIVFGPEAAFREADARGLWRLGDGKHVLAQAEAQIELSLRRLMGEIPF